MESTSEVNNRNEGFVDEANDRYCLDQGADGGL